MRLRIIETLRYTLDGTGVMEAVAVAADAEAGRLFVPGALPCGECPACRRGLVAICPARRALDGAAPGAELDLPDRFLVPIDDVEGLAPLATSTALLAGPAALALQGLALASAAPADVVLWLGGDPLARLGARAAAARGMRSFLLLAADTSPSMAEPVTASADPAALAEAMAAVETPTGGHAARIQRHLVATRSDPTTWAAAIRLAAPGGTLTWLGPGPLRLPAVAGAGPDAPGGAPLPPELRLLRTGAYHPDLVPESLALLRRETGFADHLQGSPPDLILG